MSILGVDTHDTILALMAESIVIEAAITASEGQIIAVEPDSGSRRSMLMLDCQFYHLVIVNATSFFVEIVSYSII